MPEVSKSFHPDEVDVSISEVIDGIYCISGFVEGYGVIATSAVVALGTDATRIPYYISSGFLPEQYYYLIPFLFASAFLESYVGGKVVTRIDQEKFEKLVLIAIILVSIKFILDGITAIL